MYKIYDVNGLVGDFATTEELKLFTTFVNKSKKTFLKEFFSKGAALIGEDLYSEIFRLKSKNVSVRNIILNLQEFVESADTVLILAKN